LPWSSLAAETLLRALRGMSKIKILEGLSNSKNMVFNVKKLLNVGLGLTLRRNGGKNRCERNERQI
jgi:hypothetical protein